MKMRINGESVRLRLQRQEVARLRDDGRVADILTFGPSITDTFEFALEISRDETARLRVRSNTVVVEIPATWVTTLAGSDKVGYDVTIETAPGKHVRILVEKDYRCLQDRPGEDDSDAYVNPDADACASR